MPEPLRSAPGAAAGGRDLTFARAVELAAELIRIPSLPGDEEAVARRIVRELRALGFDEARTDRAGSVIGRIAGTGGARAPVRAVRAALEAALGIPLPAGVPVSLAPARGVPP